MIRSVIVSGVGGGPSVRGSVAQEESALSVRRTIRPPRIDITVPFSSIDLDLFVIALERGTPFHDPQDNPTYRPQQS